MQRYKSKPEDDKLIYDESADVVERASAISRLTVDGFYEIEPLLVKLLDHESFLLRGEAIKSLLGFWRKSEYIDNAVRLLRTDRDPTVRSDAAFALSRVTLRTGKQREMIVEKLVEGLMQDEDFGVHEECYRGLLQILAPERSLTTIPTYFNRERDVDWELLKPYLDQQPA